MKALVTNCTRNSGVVAMQALAAAGWTVFGADDRVPRGTFHARCAQRPYALLPAEDAPDFGTALLALLDEMRPDVLIPTRGIETACTIAGALRARSAVLVPRPESFADCNDKARLLTLCATLGIAAPRRLEPEEARAQLSAGTLDEVVVKPCRDVGGGQGVWRVGDAEQLVRRHAEVSAQYGAALVTEVIPGPTTALRALHLLFDAQTRLVGAFSLRKTRLWPPWRGVTVAAESTHEPALVAHVLPLFQALQWQGAADVELKIDPRSGRPAIIEINPRFSGALAFPIGCGLDLATRYCRAALGEHLPEDVGMGYRAGRRYVDTSRWLAAVCSAGPGRANVSQARREWSARVPGAGRGDAGARLAKLALALPGGSRRWPHA